MRGKKIPLEGWRKDVPFVNFHRGQKPFNILFRRMNEKKKKKNWKGYQGKMALTVSSGERLSLFGLAVGGGRLLVM